ncbi:hypothetical protein B0A52_00640 [Exophiala mesophila]|uniref:Metallo-beta-lactamase domain-containing protein n=1 Tax=Exophiala mesophila TaxID=212818 RepID=A0A438NHT4_EXOME|nr:hypothetical protein B0A52_00640 [Exophiala mesophila]
MAQTLPKLADWEQISTNVIRVMGANPSKFTLQGSNTYILGSGPRRLLLDTAQGEKAWLDNITSALSSQAQSPVISTAILTHWHHDHIGGVKDLESTFPDVKVYKHLPNHDPDGLLDPSRVIDIQDGQVFKVEGTDSQSDVEIQAIHSPGHAKDHMAFVITSSPDADEIGAIFTADNVLGHGTAVFEDLALYLDSLAVMKRKVQDQILAQQKSWTDGSPMANVDGIKKRAFPGHGAVIEDAVSKIDEYVSHRRMREVEALNVLKYGTTKSPESPFGNNPGNISSSSISSKKTPRAAPDSLTIVGSSESEESDVDSQAAAIAGVAKEATPGKEWTSLEMVKVIYRHYPENLYQPAEYGLIMVLEKLKKDGKVVKTGEGKWRACEKATL